jgi:hypothetical protein
MNNKTKILQELQKTAPLLASVNKTNVFRVPHNYFDGLANVILSKINVSQNTQTNELGDIAPTLLSIGKQNVYTIPKNYFKTFQVNIPPAEKPFAKIIKINTIIKYAVAAAVAGIIFTGSFLFKQHYVNQSILPESVSNTIKNISDDELNKYAEEHSLQLNDDSEADDGSELNIAAELQVVSDEELEQYYQNEHQNQYH